VISRIFRVQTPLPKGRKEIRERAGVLAPTQRPGDYGQALMDLGATICTPRSPSCLLCPWQNYCEAYQKGDQTTYPKKRAKVKQPIRYGSVFVAQDSEVVLVETRPDKGLLGGMIGLPGTEWTSTPDEQALSYAPLKAKWRKLDGEVKHVFTHFELRLTVFTANISSDSSNQNWADEEGLKGLPTVFKKALKAAQGK
jgi:A/G-specific adenine glycosylase